MRNYVQLALTNKQDEEVTVIPYFYNDVYTRPFFNLPQMSKHTEILRDFFNTRTEEDPEEGDYDYYVLTKDKLSKLIDVLTDHKWKWIEDRDKNEKLLFELNKLSTSFDFEGDVLLTISWADQ